MPAGGQLSPGLLDGAARREFALWGERAQGHRYIQRASESEGERESIIRAVLMGWCLGTYMEFYISMHKTRVPALYVTCHEMKDF